MRPVPSPPRYTTRAGWLVNAKTAVTDWAASTVTTHAPIPTQSVPSQPAKTEPASGVAVRVTTDPESKTPSHVAPQSMLAGLLAITPLPAPVVVTLNVYVIKLNVAVTV